MNKIAAVLIICALSASSAMAAVDIKAKSKELREGNLRVKLAAINELAKAPESDDALITAFGSEKDPFVRVKILDALTSHQTPGALDGVIAGLKDPDQRVRGAAAANLAYFGNNPKVADALAGALAASDTEQVKKNAINSLTAVGGDKSAGEISAALKNEKDRNVRLFGVKNLKKMNTGRAREELKKFESDPDKEISGLAKRKQ